MTRCDFATTVRQFYLPRALLLSLIAMASNCSPNTAVPPPRADQVEETNEFEFPDRPMNVDIAKTKKPEIRIIAKPLEMPKSRELPPESVLGPPEEDRATLTLIYDTVLFPRKPVIPTHRGWQYRKNQKGKIVGFEFSNRGGNRVLPHRYNGEQNLFFTRDFQFRFDDRARQDIQLYISDWVPSQDKRFRLSGLMNSVIYFFPRTYLPAIVNLGKRSIVTLPTGEEVDFDAATYEILGGVLSEKPVDLNPNRAARKFPGIHYTGKGIVVHANGRGTDPRLAGVATILNGAAAAHCNGGASCSTCQVPSKELWHQNGAIRFKFPTDEEFNRYLNSRCGFGLPQEGHEFGIASPHKADRPSAP